MQQWNITIRSWRLNSFVFYSLTKVQTHAVWKNLILTLMWVNSYLATSGRLNHQRPTFNRRDFLIAVFETLPLWGWPYSLCGRPIVKENRPTEPKELKNILPNFSLFIDQCQFCLHTSERIYWSNRQEFSLNTDKIQRQDRSIYMLIRQLKIGSNHRSSYRMQQGGGWSTSGTSQYVIYQFFSNIVMPQRFTDN